jgi:16S rRNA (guanine(966)-N(2))-methyltransferase RsmD
LRIVGGAFRGRTLRAVPGTATRPTADRVRQSLFDLLGQRMDGLNVLDLYAGTGALGLEAISRGASRAVLIEKDARACGVIHGNIADLRVEDRVQVLRGDLPQALSGLHGQRFDLVFSDPPYALHAAQAVVDAVQELLAPGARLVLEMERRELAPVLPQRLSLADERRYGDTLVRVIAKAG